MIEIESSLHLLSVCQVMDELFHHLLFIRVQITIWGGIGLLVKMRNPKNFSFLMLKRDEQTGY